MLQFIQSCTLPWYCDTSLSKIDERIRMLRAREKKKKDTNNCCIFSLLSSSSNASNQPTDRSCSVAMTNVTHTTIFRLCRSDIPTSQNRSICPRLFFFFLLFFFCFYNLLVKSSELYRKNNF
jgi:hypothetical protein